LKDIATWTADGTIEGFVDDGKNVLLATDKGLRRLDPATGQEVAFTPFLKGNEGKLRAFNGRTAVVANRGARMSVFDVSAPEKVRSLDMPDRDPRSVALSADGKYLAIGGDYDYGVFVYDLVRGEPIRYIASKDADRNFVVGLAFAPDSKSMVFCSGHDKPMFVLWDLDPSAALEG
jgi:WD40 repeat protein